MSSTPASMLQVVASGLQDRERLNSPGGRPSIQFYKSVMRKRTRWASQWRRVEFDNLADFGRTAVCTLPIQGELITRATLVVDLPDIYTTQRTVFDQQMPPNNLVSPYWAWTNGLGHAICSDVQMLIADQIIDRFDSRHLEVLDEQTRPVEHFDSTDLLIARDPSTFSDRQTNQIYGTAGMTVPQSNPQTLEIVFPFWWNRGPGPQALPIQALAKDKVQLKVTFRPVQECVYTSTRIDPRNTVQLSATQGAGPMPNIAGCGFYIQDPAGVPIYSAASTEDLAAQGLVDGFQGSVLAGSTMPMAYHFTDAYWIIEYVSLEDREASAYRMADLEIPIEQHVPMPVVTTGGTEHVRIRMDQAGLVRDLTWVAQRVEAPSYNAYFLFSKDLGPAALPAPLIGPAPLDSVQSPCDIPWWPNAEIPNWDYGDGYILPAFADRRSDPIVAAKMLIRGQPRFEHEGPSMFRSLIPALGSKRGPLIDRYNYRYDFGFWPTGGLAEAENLPLDEIRGCSNWDKLPKRELALTMAQSSCGPSHWVFDGSQAPLTVSGDAFVLIDPAFSFKTEAFLVSLVGAHPDLSDGSVDLLGSNGDGATVLGVLDFNQLRRQAGYIGTYLRTNAQGSASLVLKTTAGYTWLAVAGAGGYGQFGNGSGGYAGSAVEIGWQGGNLIQTHEAVDSSGGVVLYSNRGRTNPLLFQPAFQSPSFLVIYNAIVVKFQITVTNITTPVYVYFFDGLVTNYLYTIPQQTGDPIPITYIFQDAGVTLGGDTPTTKYVDISGFTILQGDSIYIELLSAPIIVPLSEVFSAATYNSELSCIIYAATTFTGLGGSLSSTLYGGAGGGSSVLGENGVGQVDGQMMQTTAAFVESHQQTGGTTAPYHGGDGYYGGGSGTLGGGGGGSYVSSALQQVNTFENIVSKSVSASVTPISSVSVAAPSFNIYSWVTRYNRLRINSGRGTLMFNEAA